MFLLSLLPDTQPLDRRCWQPEQWGQAACSPSAWPEVPSCQENGDGLSCSNLIICHCQALLLLPKDGRHRQSTFPGGRCHLGWLVVVGDEGIQKAHAVRFNSPVRFLCVGSPRTCTLWLAVGPLHHHHLKVEAGSSVRLFRCLLVLVKGFTRQTESRRAESLRPLRGARRPSSCFMI